MAEMGLFTGWGPPVRGREAKSLEVFNEAVAYWGRQQEQGRIESFEVVLLHPHGGDLYGFLLARGSRAELEAIRAEEEFERLSTRAGMIVEGFGVVPCLLGDTLGRGIEQFQAAISELG
jgi:hypothetical protein